MENNNTIQPEKVRVSIFERIVPLAAFGLAAAAGGIGGWRITSLMSALRSSENAGIGAVSGGLAEYTIYPLVLLYAAAALGVVGICVAIGRMVITTSTSSPSGVSYIVLGVLSLSCGTPEGSLSVCLMEPRRMASAHLEQQSSNVRGRR